MATIGVLLVCLVILLAMEAHVTHAQSQMFSGFPMMTNPFYSLSSAYGGYGTQGGSGLPVGYFSLGSFPQYGTSAGGYGSDGRSTGYMNLGGGYGSYGGLAGFGQLGGYSGLSPYGFPGAPGIVPGFGGLLGGGAAKETEGEEKGKTGRLRGLFG